MIPGAPGPAGGGEARRLRPWDTPLLNALAETGALTSLQVGQDVWRGSTGREAASTAGPHLKRLESWGLVRRLDEARPMAWLRTPAGTEALAAADPDP